MNDTTAVTIRAATVADAPQISALLAEVFFADPVAC